MKRENIQAIYHVIRILESASTGAASPLGGRPNVCGGAQLPQRLRYAQIRNRKDAKNGSPLTKKANFSDSVCTSCGRLCHKSHDFVKLGFAK